MIKCEDLKEIFEDNGLTFFSGVPDSTFKDWMKFLSDNDGEGLKNVIAVNECEAAAAAAGYHLATGKVGVVYMQNSGLGKIVNPTTSLLSKDVYSIPAVFMVGWRGEPGKKDEPQHKMMGRIMEDQLKTLEMKCEVLPDDIDEARKVVRRIKDTAVREGHPTALIVKKGTLEEYAATKKSELQIPPVKQTYSNISMVQGDVIDMTREEAIREVVKSYSGDEATVSTTGKASRELFELREELGQGHAKDFLTVGSMGCSSAIALGIALNGKKPVYVFDGDGAALMQMGSFATIGNQAPANLRHIIFDNQAYGSTGKQPTVSGGVDFGAIALASGYASARTVNTYEGLREALGAMKLGSGPALVRVLVKPGARKELGRPTTTPIENKEAFMGFLSNQDAA